MCWLNPEPKLKNLTFTLLYFLIIIEIISIDFVAPLTAGWSPSKLTCKRGVTTVKGKKSVTCFLLSTSPAKEET